MPTSMYAGSKSATASIPTTATLITTAQATSQLLDEPAQRGGVGRGRKRLPLLVLRRGEGGDRDLSPMLRLAACAAAAGLAAVWLRRRARAQEPAACTWVASLDAPTIAAARSSCRLRKEALLRLLVREDDYEQLLDACARNVKMGPFKATSGLDLTYLLNAATNLLDHQAAPMATRMTLDVLRCRFMPGAVGEKILVVGGEVGGGIMVGQCAALAALGYPDICQRCDFAYMRKKRKTSGTLQQLEAPSHITQRTPERLVTCCAATCNACALSARMHGEHARTSMHACMLSQAQHPTQRSAACGMAGRGQLHGKRVAKERAAATARLQCARHWRHLSRGPLA